VLAVEKDIDGKIIAYVEYFIVNGDGNLDDNGKFCYVRYLWLWEGCRGEGLIRKFLNQEIPRYKQVEKIYWKFEKYNNRIKEFDIHRLLKER